MSGLIAVVVGGYAAMLVVMLAYGVNALALVVVHAMYRHRATPPPPPPDPAPHVTVQLAVFNEANVVTRLLDAACALDWPRDRLEIQLLDDSTDRTPEIAGAHIERLRADGHRVTHLRRRVRTGYKAGALQNGMRQCRGEFLALFDADFVPPADFLVRAMGRFRDPVVAAVQGRWTHLNRDYSGLTQAEALGIDSHFGVEQGARFWAGWFLNFNGSAGVWRRAAIDDAGGWSGDTLTEDLDLSYRVQLRGWRLVYDPDLECPSELPVDMAAFKAQQRRWATGSIQTARKLLPAVWRSDKSLGAKIQATLHLTHYSVHLLIAATAVLAVPCVLIPGASADPRTLWTLLVPFVLAMSGPTVLHLYAQRIMESRTVRLREMWMLTLIGVGIAVSNAKAVLAGFSTKEREFERTPKHGIVNRTDRPAQAYRAPSDGLRPWEAGLAAYCLATAIALLWSGIYELAPFMLLDAAGLAYVAALARLRVRA